MKLNIIIYGLISGALPDYRKGNKYSRPHQGKQECARRRKQTPDGLMYDCSIMGNCALNWRSMRG